MHLRSDSFNPWQVLPTHLAFGKHDPETHFTFADNINPHLAWSGAPSGTQSFVVLCVDSDVPSEGSQVNKEGMTVPLDLPRSDFFHWVLIDLPPSTQALTHGAHSQGVTQGGKAPGPSNEGGLQGLNSFTDWFAGHPTMGGDYAGYDGPAPPWNDERVHGYCFVVYALDISSLGLSGAFTGPEVRQAMQGHVLDKARITGLYAINPAVSG